MSDEPTEAFELKAQIATFFRYIDRGGSVAVRDGNLVLQKRSGAVIAEAPISDVQAVRLKRDAGASLQLKLKDTKYIVRPETYFSHSGGGIGGGRAELLEGLIGMKRGRQLTEQFLAILESLGAQVGKPSK